jgi:hypothetical protein
MSILTTINTQFWRWLAKFVSHPPVRDWLVLHAKRTPYSHILSPDGTEAYMMRYWLFNPYHASGEAKRFGWGWLPSVRIHHILIKDQDRHHHDHPWNARTIVLQGGYSEERSGTHFARVPGDTATLRFEEYHRINYVTDGGVYTLFITWKHCGDWGFNVNGKKVPWREYLATEKNNGLSQ